MHAADLFAIAKLPELSGPTTVWPILAFLAQLSGSTRTGLPEERCRTALEESTSKCMLANINLS